MLNKTSYGSPYDKSAYMSYLETPNENSMNMSKNNKLKKFKSHKNMDMSKLKEAFPSTEDENVSGESVKVCFMIGKKKIGEKKFFSFEGIEEIKK